MDDLTLSDWLSGREPNKHTHTDYTQSYITPLGDTSIVPNNPCRPLGGHTDQTKAVAKIRTTCHL